MRQRRPTIASQAILLHDTYLHPSLIHNRQSLVKAMRIHFYRGLSGTENDGGGLQWDFISRCWIRYTSLRNFHFLKTSVTSKKSRVLSSSPSPGGIAVRPKVHHKKGRQNVWSTIIIKPSGPYTYFGPWIDKLPNGSLPFFQTSWWTWRPLYKDLN